MKRFVFVCFAIALTACSQTSHADDMATRERHQLALIKSKYPTVLMGFDFKGPELIASIDMNGLVEQDDDAEDAMRRETLQSWKRIYHIDYPNDHRAVSVRFVDFQGHTQFTEPGKH